MSVKRHTSLMAAADVQELTGFSRSKATNMVKACGGCKDVTGKWTVDSRTFFSWYNNPCRSSVAGGGVYHVDIDNIVSEVKRFSGGEEVSISLHKRKETTIWKLRIYASNRRNKVISLNTDDKRKAQAIEGEIRSRLHSHSLNGITPYSTIRYLEEWLALKEKEISNGSFKRYRTIIDKVTPFLPHQIHLVKQSHIEQYKAWMTREGYQPRSIILELNTLKQIFKNAVSMGYSIHNPVEPVKNPKKPVTMVEPYTDKELALIFQEFDRRVESEHREQKCVIAWSAYREIFYCLYYTGLRISDVLSLKWENIGTNFSTIVLKQEKTKKPVYIRIPSDFKERFTLISHMQLIPSPFVFVNSAGKQVSYTQVDKAIRAVLKTCGFEKRSPIHSFRHTVALRLLDSGIPVHQVANQLGDTVETIVRNYVKPKTLELSLIDAAYSQVSRKCHADTAEIAVFGGNRRQPFAKQNEQISPLKKGFLDNSAKPNSIFLTVSGE